MTRRRLLTSAPFAAPRRLLVAVLAGALLIAPASLLVPGPANAAVTFAAPTANPAAPLVGERFTVSGSVGAPGARPVRLQTRVEGVWVNGPASTTTSSGRYTFVLTVKKAATVRVVAPATRTRSARRSAARVVVPRTTAASLAISGTRETATAAGTVAPARVGRSIHLQTFSPATASWQTLETKTQGSGTGLTWTLRDLDAGAASYRLVAGAWKGAAASVGPTVSFTPVQAHTDLPDLVLTTTAAAPVDSKEVYVPGTLTVDGGAALPMQIKGRGNSTWALPKKPYRIKLDAKASLLGLPEEKDWVLLANYSDRSALRNWTAFEIAKRTSLAWTPSSRFVDVTLNGVDLGLYQLVEQVEESAAKVALAPGGLLLEVDQRRVSNGDPGFQSSTGLEISYKDPDDPTPEQQTAVAALVNQFEAALYSPTFTDPGTGYARFVDLTSFADWYLVNEAMLNLDSDFYSSVFFSWDPAGKLTLGPVWDFDLSSGFTSGYVGGCCEETSGWWLRPAAYTGRGWHHNVHWLARITQDPAFLALVKQRWNAVVGPAVSAVRASLAEQQRVLHDAAERDWAIWNYATTPGGGSAHAADQAGEVRYLSTWLGDRTAWISDQLD